MTHLKAILDALAPADGGWRAAVPANWLQGRTVYGGLSAALALHAAQRSEPDLPPLRSALVAFVGPLGGDLTIRTALLRRGRNAAFVQADVTGDAGLGLRATFVFMAPVESSLDHRAPRLDEAPPATDAPVTRGHPAVAFTQNFEMVDAALTGEGNGWHRWIRLADRAGLDPAVELMAVADALPPAAISLIGRLVPLSSMTWQINLLGTPAPSPDGWWLLSSATRHARDGNSSERTAIWNGEGVQVAEQMQSVALFG